MHITRRLLAVVALTFLIAGTALSAFQLTVNNNTDTGFTAKTVGGQVLGYIAQGAQNIVLNVPFVPQFPTYAVSLVGDNGGNGSVINKGDGPFCSTQFVYHDCVFTNVTAYHATVSIKTTL